MADDSEKSSKKKNESMRERAERAIAEASKGAKPIKVEKQKEPESKKKLLPTKIKRSKTKTDKIKKDRRFHLIPRFFPEAWAELRQVTWPDARNTTRLTTAVIIFSIIFSAVVSIVDYGFGIVFKKVFLHG